MAKQKKVRRNQQQRAFQKDAARRKRVRRKVLSNRESLRARRHLEELLAQLPAEDGVTVIDEPEVDIPWAADPVTEEPVLAGKL